MSRPLIARHHKVLINKGLQLLGKGGRPLAGGDPLVEGLLLLIEKPLDDHHRLVVAVGKVAVEDDAGGGRRAGPKRLRPTDGLDVHGFGKEVMGGGCGNREIEKLWLEKSKTVFRKFKAFTQS